MPEATPFTALGRGNGFPFCVPHQDGDGTNGVSFSDASMLYWNLSEIIMAFDVTEPEISLEINEEHTDTLPNARVCPTEFSFIDGGSGFFSGWDYSATISVDPRPEFEYEGDRSFSYENEIFFRLTANDGETTWKTEWIMGGEIQSLGCTSAGSSVPFSNVEIVSSEVETIGGYPFVKTVSVSYLSSAPCNGSYPSQPSVTTVLEFAPSFYTY